MNVNTIAARLAGYPLKLTGKPMNAKTLKARLEEAKGDLPFESDSAKLAKMKAYVEKSFGSNAGKVFNPNYVRWAAPIPKTLTGRLPNTIPEGQEGGRRRRTQRRRRSSPFRRSAHRRFRSE